MVNAKALLCSAVLIGSGILSTSADAQMSFETAFGNGVHYYFSHDYQKAYDSLTMALAENGQDARAYYFRGLASEQLGKGGSADFEMGARIEASQGGRLSIVNDSLERVQGSTRITIENLRREAVMTAKRSNYNQPVVGRTFPVQNSGAAVEMPGVVKSPSPDSVAPNQEVKQTSNVTPSPDASVETVDSPEPSTTVVEEKNPEPKVDLPFGDAVDEGTPDVSESVSPFGDSAATEDKPANTEEVSPFGVQSDAVATEEKEKATEETPFGAVEDSAKEVSPFGAAESNDEAGPADKEVSPFGNPADINEEAESPFGESEEPMDEVSPFGDAAVEKKEPADSPSPFGDAKETEGSDESVDDVSPFGEKVVEESEETPDSAGEPASEEKTGDGAPDDPFDL